MKLYWTLEAIADRDAIFDYIEADNPAAALALDELFSEKAERLTDHPKLGRQPFQNRKKQFSAGKSGNEDEYRCPKRGSYQHRVKRR